MRTATSTSTSTTALSRRPPAPGTLSLMYELFVDPALWMLSGKPKATFELAPGESIDVHCKLLPIAAGYLPIPTVELRQARTHTLPVITPAALSAAAATGSSPTPRPLTSLALLQPQATAAAATSPAAAAAAGMQGPTTTFVTYERVHPSRVLSRHAQQQLYVYPPPQTLASAQAV